MKPFVIAEFASCHMGVLDNALKGIEVARVSQANAFKVQSWSSPERMRARRKVSAPAYEQGSVPADWHATLKKECHDRGLLYSASVFLPEDIPVLAPHVDFWKVSSFEARDRKLTQLIPRDERTLFVSTGMQTAHDESYLPRRGIRLHCVSAYPCPPYEANLGAIERGQGYSDHTRCVFTGAFAVAAGADYLEVHYRLADTPVECADYPVSLDPEELGKYVALAREAARMRGDGKKQPQLSELENAEHRVLS
jgi:sialic acid synthase SpsE